MSTKIASTLTEILHNPIVEASLDRSRPVEPYIEKTLEAWQVDLDKRRPAPAYTEGLEGQPIYRGSDFDLFTFLMALAQRQAVINIPSYENLRPTVLQSNQRLIDRKNRHGQILKVVSNNDVHSFSVRIMDYNVVETTPNGTEEVGAFRHYAVVDDFGEWYDGWHELEFRATEKERSFLEERKLVVYEEPVRFEGFVHPHLAMAFYGSRYITAKALAARLNDQAKHYRGLAKMLRDMEVRLPEDQQQEVTYEKIGDGQRIVVPNIEARLILPEPTGKYPIISLSEDGKVTQYKRLPRSMKAFQGILRYSEQKSNDLSYGTGAAVRAPVRAVELAYFLHGFDGQVEAGRERTPSWGIPQWTRDYRESSGHRIRWNALQLTESPDVFLIYRIRETTQVRSQPYIQAEPVHEPPKAVLV